MHALSVIGQFLLGAAILLPILWALLRAFGSAPRGRGYLAEKCQRASDEQTGAASPRAPLGS